MDKILHQPHFGEQRLHLREMRFEVVLRLVFEVFCHGGGAVESPAIVTSMGSAAFRSVWWRACMASQPWSGTGVRLFQQAGRDRRVPTVSSACPATMPLTAEAVTSSKAVWARTAQPRHGGDGRGQDRHPAGDRVFPEPADAGGGRKLAGTL